MVSWKSCALFQCVRNISHSLDGLLTTAMSENNKTDAGKSGLTYYQTLLEPANWWQWFQDDYKSEQGWTEVVNTTYT